MKEIQVRTKNYSAHPQLGLGRNDRALLRTFSTWTKRLFDFVVALILSALLLPLFLITALLIKMTSKGPVIHWSSRVGQNNRLFRMPKFRSMQIETPQVATHLLSDSSNYFTPIGSFLRRTSLDELPQLFSILAGDLSFVGPRPALFNQDDLVALRTELGIHQVIPGLTGWAQVNGRDELPIPVKVQFDFEYLLRQSFTFDLRIMVMTLVKVIRREGISH
ncbi:MAG TPA: sugar transferase [Terracidiphilus sp.]|nr:sugar transferase [Terracidiphilus sp.]